MMTKGISRKGLSSESKGQEIVGLTDPKSQIIDIREGWIHQTIPFDSMYFNNYFMIYCSIIIYYICVTVSTNN